VDLVAAAVAVAAAAVLAAVAEVAVAAVVVAAAVGEGGEINERRKKEDVPNVFNFPFAKTSFGSRHGHASQSARLEHCANGEPTNNRRGTERQGL
jgi:hypothetical protein